MEQKKLEQIIITYYHEIYFFILVRLSGNTHDAYDLTQDVFLLMQERIGGLIDNNIRGWLYSVASNKVYEHYRRSQNKEISIDSFANDISVKIDFQELMREREVSDKEIYKIKYKIIKQLSNKERDLFEKIYMQKYKHADVARLYGISSNALYIRLHRLRKKIKEKVNTLISG